MRYWQYNNLLSCIVVRDIVVRQSILRGAEQL